MTGLQGGLLPWSPLRLCCEIPSLRVLGHDYPHSSTQSHLIGNASTHVPVFHPQASTPTEAIQARLLAQGINVWTSQAQSTRIDMEERGLDSVVRASVHAYNTLDEVRVFLEVLRAILEDTI